MNLFSGPRILYDPVRWNISALRRTLHPVAALSIRDDSSGVRCVCGATCSNARSNTPSSSGSVATVTWRRTPPSP